ncbi:hypothetical protein H4R34_000809 [Dimargaris verticillata]|uniref:Diphthine--ammonia ligase n=1 Tax=Dimargaris verticillata TaxID=2761393 RepID=A0A9W8B5Z1_9FUNG|nr:hypothetical protein H4R34_000809 [Dimargaris verticillata]
MGHVMPSPLVRRSDDSSSPYVSDIGLTSDEEDNASVNSHNSDNGEPTLPATERAAVAVAQERIMPYLLSRHVRFAVEEFDRCYTFILMLNQPATFEPAHIEYISRLMAKIQTETYPANILYIPSYLTRLEIDAGEHRNYPVQQFMGITQTGQLSLAQAQFSRISSLESNGGKDSCYNMVQCVKDGHEIVALANAHPEPANGQDELDSYLFQTVGYDGVPYIAESMDLPLYRAVIKGTPIVQTLDYEEAIANDETEDLFGLIQTVLDHHPDVQGVSVGAIFSNYQGKRVENVCKRLGLTMLPYLWERDQKSLLKEMVDEGMRCILIKVAAIGLNANHLGKTIGEMYPYLCELNQKYDVHICGEGGEYETFTLDCPLFKKRIVVDESQVIHHSEDDYSPVSYFRLLKLHTEPK